MKKQQKPVQVEDVKNMLNANVQRLRKTIKKWNDSDLCYGKLAELRHKTDLPVKLGLLLDDGSTLAIDTTSLDAKGRALLLQLLMSCVTDQYDLNLSQLMTTSATAYSSLQEFKQY